MLKSSFTQLALLLLVASTLRAQSDQLTPPPLKIESPAAIQQRQLGQFLFRSTLLSLDGSQSCATCHQEDRAFTDGLVEPPGILGTGGGRNTPTLIAMRHVAAFPGPKAVKGKSSEIRVRALTLEERCLAPIENPLEMAASLDDVIKRLRETPGMDEKFTAAFGGGTPPVTEQRLGKALAAYVRNFSPKKSRYHRYLAGDKEALSDYELTGLKTFEKLGCASCHSGEGMTDGLMHPVFTPGSERSQRQSFRSNQIASEARQEKSQRKLKLPKKGLSRQIFDGIRVQSTPQGGCDNMGRPQRPRGGYDGGTTPGLGIEMQTLTLWDVQRTAPYFRDGSEPTLEGAVARHVKDLAQVYEQRKGVTQLLEFQKRTKQRPPQKLRAKDKDIKKLRSLRKVDPKDLNAMVAFLKTLSPGTSKINKPRESNG